MVTDQQVRRLMSFMKKTSTIASAAAKADMDEKTARKYLGTERLPSQMKKEHNWRTRKDPFEDIWDEIRENFKTVNCALFSAVLKSGAP